MDHKPRKILNRIESFINTNDIIVIQGARQTGKTTLLKIIIDQLQNKRGIAKDNIIYFDLEDFALLELCDNGASDVVKYIEAKKKLNKQQKVYLLVDEIQYLSNPSNLLKVFHDHYSHFKLIVSGSSSFDIRKKFKDSLVGRTVEFELFTLDFDEFLNFKGVPYDLFDSKIFKLEVINNEILPLFKEYLVYGGYPRITLEKNIENKEIFLKQIINTYVKKDIRDLAKIRDVNRFNNFLRILSDSSGKQLNVLELSNTVGLARQTIEDYLFILEKTYVIKLVRPFFSNIRSEITKMPKIFFEDTGMLNVLRYGGFIDKIDGALFENGSYSILRKNFSDEGIKYWRSKQKREVDFILDLGRKVIPIETKLTYPEKAGNNLLHFLEKYKQEKGFVVSFQKPHKKGKCTKIKFLYPWELFWVLKRELGKEMQYG